MGDETKTVRAFHGGYLPKHTTLHALQLFDDFIGKVMDEGGFGQVVCSVSNYQEVLMAFSSSTKIRYSKDQFELIDRDDTA